MYTKSGLFAILSIFALGACSEYPIIVIDSSDDLIDQADDIVDEKGDDPCTIVQGIESVDGTLPQIKVGGNDTNFLVATRFKGDEHPYWNLSIYDLDGNLSVVTELDTMGKFVMDIQQVSSAPNGFVLNLELYDNGWRDGTHVVHVGNDGSQRLVQAFNENVVVAISEDGEELLAGRGRDTTYSHMLMNGGDYLWDEIESGERVDRLMIGGLASIGDITAYSRYGRKADGNHEVELTVASKDETRVHTLSSFVEQVGRPHQVFAWDDTFTVHWTDAVNQGRLTTVGTESWGRHTNTVPSAYPGYPTIDSIVQGHSGLVGVDRYGSGDNQGVVVVGMDRNGVERFRYHVLDDLYLPQINDSAVIAVSGNRAMVAFTGGAFGETQEAFTAIVECRAGI